MTGPARVAKRVFRIGTLLVPTWLAWYVAFSSPRESALRETVTLALGPLWAMLVGAIVVRLVLRIGDRKAGLGAEGHPLDVLTGAGSSLGWMSAIAIMAAVRVGWASLAVVGLLGTGVFHIVVIHALLRLRNPVQDATIERRFGPESPIEGDEVTEELRLAGARIPIGFRMFVTGRVGPRWATSRYVLEASESGGEIALAQNLGAATRGEHVAEPLEIWLEDTFGLCRSPRARVAAERLTVLPRVPKVAALPIPIDKGVGPRAPRSTHRLPTEGLFDLREYREGDDVRRIHWVRSLAAGEVVVRLPDEVPPDRPEVRLVLDTFFPEAQGLTHDAPAELLDHLVGIWIAVGRALARTGVRVTMVMAAAEGDEVVIERHQLSLRADLAALRLGARARWQGKVRATDIDGGVGLVVTRGVLAPPREGKKTRLIVARFPVASPPASPSSPLRFALPIGARENRWSARRAEDARIVRAQRDHWTEVLLFRSIGPRAFDSSLVAPPGSVAAFPQPDGTITFEALP